MLFFLIPTIIVLAYVFYVRIFLYLVTIEGSSMCPALKGGDRVLVLRHFPTSFLRKEQIVVLDLSQADSIPYPKPSVVIKRLIGLPGDVVKIHNSQVVEELPFMDMSVLSEDGYYEMQIPSGHCFVRADGNGSDSRHWGPIPLYTLVGVVIKRMSRPVMREREN